MTCRKRPGGGTSACSPRRYGNVYTVAQAVQLFRRAYGDFEPSTSPGSATRRVRSIRSARRSSPTDSRPTRRCQPIGTPPRARPVRCSRLSDVLVFTLGLTEAWRSAGRRRGLPTAPGVAGGSYDPDAPRVRQLRHRRCPSRSRGVLRSRPGGQSDAVESCSPSPRSRSSRPYEPAPCARVDDLQQVGAARGRRRRSAPVRLRRLLPVVRDHRTGRRRCGTTTPTISVTSKTSAWRT